MSDSDRDFWGLVAVLALLALSGLLSARVLARHDEEITRLAGDVGFLMDRPPVSREAEETS